MDPKIIADAAVYSRIKATGLAYYHAHAQEIAERRKIKYREAHPNPRPRGRPRKSDLLLSVVDSNNASSTNLPSSVQVVT